MATQIKVMIVDDHDMVRLGLRTYLLMLDDVEVIAEAGNGKEAFEMLNNNKSAGEPLPDIILMDLNMPMMDGIEATAKIMERLPSMKIIILTSFLEDEKVMKAVEAGAASYVMKTISADELGAAIRTVYSGLPVMSPEVSQALTRGLRERTHQKEDSELTAREKEVLLLIAEGKSNKEISEQLFISIKTVKTHVSNLLLKCELNDRTQLAIYAHRKGWA